MNMKFDEFTNRILEELNGRFKGGNVRIKIQEVKRPNASYVGLSLGKTDIDLAFCANLENAYAYVKARGFEDSAVEEVVESFSSAVNNIPPLDLKWLKDYDKAKTRLFTRVYNTGCEGLRDYPYTTVHDLAITYAVRIESENGMVGAAPVTRDLLSAWGKKLPDLVRDSRKSQEKVMPPKFMNMAEVLPFSVSEPQPLYILTNAESFYGASAIFYPDMMEKIAEILGGDYFVIPSSIHETMLLPVDEGMEADVLGSIIQSVNGECLVAEDRLSDHAYRYNAATREFVMV